MLSLEREKQFQSVWKNINSKCLPSHVGIFMSPTLKRLMCIQLDRVGLQNSSSRAPLLLTFPLFNLMQVCELQVLVVALSAGVSLGRGSVTNSRSFIPPAMFDLRPFRFRVDGRGGAGKPHPPPSLLLTISQEVRYKGLPVKYWAQDLQNHASSLQAMLFVMW